MSGDVSCTYGRLTLCTCVVLLRRVDLSNSVSVRVLSGCLSVPVLPPSRVGMESTPLQGGCDRDASGSSVFLPE